jgi:hypothetical protein
MILEIQLHLQYLLQHMQASITFRTQSTLTCLNRYCISSIYSSISNPL